MDFVGPTSASCPKQKSIESGADIEAHLNAFIKAGGKLPKVPDGSRLGADSELQDFLWVRELG
jgi:hypothetical protein